MSHLLDQKFGGARLAYFDGGMGTLLQAMGLKGGERPERWNIEHPERIKGVHLSYLNAGADIVTTNSFGATRAHLGEEAPELMRAAVRVAKAAVAEAGHGFVAADMGSIGKLLVPYGDMPFEEALGQFKESFTCAIEEGADLILIETMTDLLEVKACTLAAKEAMKEIGKKIPLFVSLTFDERGRLLTGADIKGTVAMLTGLRVDAIGLNCGHEPKALMDNVRALLNCCTVPVFIQPNASLPIVENGKTIFPTSPAEFAEDMLEIAKLGAWGVGGCCGTTPEHISEMVKATKNIIPAGREIPEECVISGRSSSLSLGVRPVIIGERLNPTGKPRMKQALKDGDMDYLLREAIAQIDAGADILDVNVGLPEIDEPAMLKAAITAVQTVAELPLQIDTSDPIALEGALRVYAGKPLINSVCGKQKIMDEVFPLAAKYGGAIVALTLDESGIPETAEGRLAIAERIIAEAAKYGISKNELLFDTLTMTVATDPNAANTTLATLRALHNEYKVKTVLGVSNVSFGLPQRPLLTAAFISMAIEAGLDAAIMNPNDATAKALFDAACAIHGKDEAFSRYLSGYGDKEMKVGITFGSQISLQDAKTNAVSHNNVENTPSNASQSPFYTAIARGLSSDAAREAKSLLAAGADPLVLIESEIMPALSDVGDRYEKGSLFLPQLLQSATAAQAAFDIIRAAMPQGEQDDSRKVILATVKGDVHDIGKNIVKVLMQNYGFTVIDLGKDVDPQVVLDAARTHGAKLVGLSALMTTTVPAMEETIALIHDQLPGVRVIVGGAVLSADYAAKIGADGYGKDAMASVRLAEDFLGK
ncbi:MAG: dihydropteroate synthase [Clostridiales bacterium]|nr:dihydropteroate synthase [Clostridiales bacterium]